MTPYVVAAAFVMGFASGSHYQSLRADRELSRQLKAEQVKTKEAQELNESLYSQLEAERSNIKTIEKEVIRKIYVPKIQKVDSNCNLSNSAKRLLNNNIMSKADTGATETDSKASDVRAADTIRYLNTAISQYNHARAQCNKLIEFVKEANNE